MVIVRCFGKETVCRYYDNRSFLIFNMFYKIIEFLAKRIVYPSRKRLMIKC